MVTDYQNKECTEVEDGEDLPIQELAPVGEGPHTKRGGVGEMCRRGQGEWRSGEGREQAGSVNEVRKGARDRLDLT